MIFFSIPLALRPSEAACLHNKYAGASRHSAELESPCAVRSCSPGSGSGAQRDLRARDGSSTRVYNHAREQVGARANHSLAAASQSVGARPRGLRKGIETKRAGQKGCQREASSGR